MNYLVLLSNVVVITYLMYVYNETFLQHYRKDQMVITSYTCMGCVVSFILLFAPIVSMPILLIGYMIIVPVYLYYGKESSGRQLFSYYCILVCCCIIVLFLQFIISIIPNLPDVELLALCNIFSICYFVVSIIYLKEQLHLDNKSYIMYVLVGLCIVFVFNIYDVIRLHKVFDHTIHLLTNAMVLLQVAMFRSFYMMEVGSENVMKLTIRRYANKQNTEKYEMIEKENQMVIQQLHDMKKHLRMLDTMQQSEEFHLYKEEIERKADEIVYTKQCGIPFIDRILQTYRMKLHESKIQCNIEIDDIDISFLNVVDLSAILANMLDNAIESCEKCEERFLLLKIKKQRDFMMIKMKNSCMNVVVEQGILKTTKENHIYHGFGIRNMQMLATKYNGELHYHFDSEHHIFTTSISLFYNRM